MPTPSYALRALILAGGSGTRFWPLSRRARPKQLLALDDERSLLQRTARRLAPLVPPERIWVCTTRALAASVREQLPGVPADQILAEPEGRNTAPAIAWAIQSMPAADLDDPVLVLPADHRFEDEAEFRRVVAVAATEAVARDRVLTLGVEPRWPETGYGYLEVEAKAPATEVRRVLRFTEKPDRETAERFLASGRYLWNAGIFTFRGRTLLELVARHLPRLAEGLEALRADPASLDDVYPRLPRVSIDFGIMEQLEEIATVPLDCGWSDLGSWEALADLLDPGDGGDATHGDVLSLDGSSNLLWAESGTIAAFGVENLIVVRTGEVVLVVPRHQSQEVRALVGRLAAAGRDELL